MDAVRLDCCNAVAGPSMSYLTPPSRHQSRIHTRDKVLTPFRTRSSSPREFEGSTDSRTPDAQTITAATGYNSDDIRRQTLSESIVATSPCEQTDRPTNPDSTPSRAADSYPAQMTSIAAQRAHPIPIVVENYETDVAKVTGSSVTSSVNAGQRGTVVAAGKGPATAAKPVTKMWPAGELSSQHHVTMTSDEARLTSQFHVASVQPLNLTSSSASSHVNTSAVSVRPPRPFSPTTRSAEPPLSPDSRPWSPRTTQPAALLPSDEASLSSSGVSSIQFVPNSRQPPVHKFTPAQRSLSPPINASISSGVVRVPYIPTPAVARSSSLGANTRVIARTAANHVQVSSPMSSLSSSSA